MISTPLVQLIIRCRSLLPAVRERAFRELGDLDPAAMSTQDSTALLTIVPDLLRFDHEADGAERAARSLLESLHCDLGPVDSLVIERVHARLPQDLSPLIVGILARQHRPEAWLSLRRVLHLELAQREHCAPQADVLEPLGELCGEPTFALDALLEAIDDPMWTVPAAQCIIAWHRRSLLSERDVERVREKIPVLEALIADSKTNATTGEGVDGSGNDSDREAIDRLFPERPLLTGS